MPRLICIVGLPGSGKTTLGLAMAEQTGVTFVDDPGVACTPMALASAILSGVDVVLADVNLCDPDARAMAVGWFRGVVPDANVEWVFFENDPDACRANIAARTVTGDARNVEGSIRRFAKVYRVPDGVEAVPVYRQPPSPLR